MELLLPTGAPAIEAWSSCGPEPFPERDLVLPAARVVPPAWEMEPPALAGGEATPLAVPAVSVIEPAIAAGWAPVKTVNDEDTVTAGQPCRASRRSAVRARRSSRTSRPGLTWRIRATDSALSPAFSPSPARSLSKRRAPVGSSARQPRLRRTRARSRLVSRARREATSRWTPARRGWMFARPEGRWRSGCRPPPSGSPRHSRRPLRSGSPLLPASQQRMCGRARCSLKGSAPAWRLSACLPTG